MKINIPKLTKNCYFLGIFFVCLKYFTERLTFINFNDSFIAILILLFFGIKIILQKNKKKEWLIIIGLILFSSLIVWKTKEKNILYIFMGICASKNINLRNTIQYIFKINVAILSFIVIAYLFNLVFDTVPVMYRTNGSIRYTFYLNHSNAFAGSVFWCVAQYVYLNFKKITKKHFIILSLLLILVYFLTDSRTTFMTSILFLTLIALMKKFNLKKQFYIASKYIFIICAACMLSLSLLYSLDKKNPVLHTIDNITSRRVSLLENALEMHGITILPKSVNLNKKYQWDSGNYGYLYLDSLYSRGFIVEGLLFIILLSYLMYKTTNYLKYHEQLFMIIFAIMAMMERYMFYPSMAFIILFFSKAIFKNQKIKHEELEAESDEKALADPETEGATA